MIVEVKRRDWLSYFKRINDRRTIGKDVQAYLSNRLVVLVLRGLVLSDKVKVY